MNIAELLTPVNGKNSVKEVSIVLILASEIIKPERFGTLIQTKFRNEFQKFEPVSQVQFGITQRASRLESLSPKISENTGFRFTKYKEGIASNVLQGVNEDLRNYISFHSLKYEDWQTEFFPEFIKYINVIAEFHPNMFAKFIGLHYVDEFSWNREGDVETNIVFNVKSDLLPKEFFRSTLSNYLFSTVKRNKYEYVDRLEISVETRVKKFLTISHNATQILEDVIALEELVTNKPIIERLESAHLHNKDTLMNLFTPEVCTLINLKK